MTINWNDYDNWRTDPDYDKDRYLYNDENEAEIEYEPEVDNDDDDQADNGYSYYRSIFQNVFKTTKKDESNEN